MENTKVRNVAIIAHVDHGKTSLVNELLKQGAKEINIVPYYKNSIDYRANIHNDLAKKFYEKRGVKVEEYSFEKSTKNNAELMRTKHCLKYAIGKCQSTEKLYLKDEFNQKYKLEFDCKNCEMIIKKD